MYSKKDIDSIRYIFLTFHRMVLLFVKYLTKNILGGLILVLQMQPGKMFSTSFMKYGIQSISMIDSICSTKVTSDIMLTKASGCQQIHISTHFMINADGGSIISYRVFIKYCFFP